MKSKRRHELQTNELADQLGHWIDRVRPHVTTFLLIVLAAVAVLVGWYYVSSSKEYEVAQAWRAYMFAGSNPQGDIIKELNMVADEFPDTQAGLWAALTAADVEAGRAVRLLFQEKATAETGLDDAIKSYERVLGSKAVKDSSMLQSRANFGLGQTLEAAGELDKAIEHYQAVVKVQADSSVAKIAQRRVERLSDSTTKKWYNWFENQKPAPPKPAAGLSPENNLGMPSTDLNVLPEGPGQDFMKGATAEEPTKDAGSDKAADKPAEKAAEPAGKATEPAKGAAEPAKKAAGSTDGPKLDGPKLDGPAVEPPKTDPPKKAAAEK